MTTANKDESQLNLSKWHLSEVATSNRGQKTCVLTGDHKSIAFHLGSRLKTRFGASCFDKNVETSRKNLDFDITNDKQICAMLKQIDDWAIQYIFDNCSKILRKVMSKDVIKLSASRDDLRGYYTGQNEDKHGWSQNLPMLG